MPQLWIVAGPNGIGKSTLTEKHFKERLKIIDPDAIAKQINPTNPEKVAVEAGKRALIEQKTCLFKKEDFLVETTLSGNGVLRLIEKANKVGYKTNLLYFSADKVGVSKTRVKLRVALGGHNIPEKDIERRYRRSLENLSKAIKLCDRSLILDSTNPKPRLQLSVEKNRIKFCSPHLKKWCKKALKPLEKSKKGIEI